MDTHSAHAQVLHTLMKINNPTNMYYAKRTINPKGELTLGDVTWKTNDCKHYIYRPTDLRVSVAHKRV